MDRPYRWPDLWHMSLLPPDSGRGGERLCAPQPAQRSWEQAGGGSEQPFLARPPCLGALGFPTSCSLVLPAELSSELSQAASLTRVSRDYLTLMGAVGIHKLITGCCWAGAPTLPIPL